MLKDREFAKCCAIISCHKWKIYDSTMWLKKIHLTQLQYFHNQVWTPCYVCKRIGEMVKLVKWIFGLSSYYLNAVWGCYLALWWQWTYAESESNVCYGFKIGQWGKRQRPKNSRGEYIQTYHLRLGLPCF